MTESSRASQELADLADEFAATGAKPGKMFGHHGLMTAQRKLICFEHSGAIVFKLPPTAYDAVLALEGTGVFKPREDRPAMSNWYVVPEQHASEWPALARATFDYVSGC